jgi:DNA mismatch repair protein MutL
MSQIKSLPPDLVSKIAAGEVIQRPKDVVKELVENAIDAEAEWIKVFLEKGGQKSIIVMDDGQGMNQTDLKLAVEAHTTSKLTQETDLYNISTLGFRGEALASIAQIGHLTLKSKPSKKSVGYQLSTKGGKKYKLKPVGKAQGTTVIVDQLFFNTPARKKFQTQPQTESQQIIKLLTQLALAHPKIRFTLSHNQRTVFDLPAQKFSQRVKTVLGQSDFDQLYALELEAPFIKLQGYIGHPQLARKNKDHQFLFVNQRSVNNPAISQSVKQAYQSLISSNTFPSFVLSMQVAPETIDVNIHPQKRKIKFLNLPQIKNLVRKQVGKRLDQAKLHFHPNENAEEPSPYTFQGNFGLELNDQAQTTVEALKQELGQVNLSQKEDTHILQINQLYLALNQDQKLILIDQHAAHERILYEKLKKIFKQEQTKTTKLNSPLVIELSLADAKLLKDNLDTLKQIGLKLKFTENKKFKLISIPCVLKQRNIKKIIKEVLDDLDSKQEVDHIDKFSEKIIHFLACRSAVKAGHYLSPEERKTLVDQLFNCDQPLTCPHGRPTMISFRPNQLAKMFKRS